MTKGEYRVGINFNPSNDDMVGRIKRAAADLIDLLERDRHPHDAAWLLLVGIGQGHVEHLHPHGGGEAA